MQNGFFVFTFMGGLYISDYRVVFFYIVRLFTTKSIEHLFNQTIHDCKFGHI